MFYTTKIGRMLAAAVLALGVAGASQAATVTWSALPTTGVVANPLATSTTGTVFENVTGSVAGVRRSPFLDSPVDVGLLASDPSAIYTSVSRNSSATYIFGIRSAFSFVWGSPDPFNLVEFLLAGNVVDTYSTFGLTNAQIFPARVSTTGATASFTNIAGGVFDSVRLTSTTSNAFEFANIAAVPVPAGGLLLVSALGGIAALRRRKAA